MNGLIILTVKVASNFKNGMKLPRIVWNRNIRNRITSERYLLLCIWVNVRVCVIYQWILGAVYDNTESIESCVFI